MSNPNRGGRGGHPNGRGGPQQHHQANNSRADVAPQDATTPSHTNGAQLPPHVGRGFPRGGGRGGYNPNFVRRGNAPGFDRGRGIPRGAMRGRGRGSLAAPLPS